MAENANDNTQGTIAKLTAMLNILIEQSEAEAAERRIPIIDKL